MSRRPGLTLAFLLAAALVPTAYARPPQDATLARSQVSYNVNGWTLHATLTPEQPSFMPGEPIYLAFALHNDSAEDLHVIVGADSDQDGRPSKFTLRIVRSDGALVPIRPSAGDGRGGIMGPQRIPAGGGFSFPLLLPEWAEFKDAGTYTITATRIVDIGKYTRDMAWTNLSNNSHLSVSASTTVRVTRFDAAALGDAIAARSAVMLSPARDAASEAAAQAAAKALATMDDERVVAPFAQTLAVSDYSVNFIALNALARFTSDAARAAAKQAASDPDPNVQRAAAFALSKQEQARGGGGTTAGPDRIDLTYRFTLDGRPVQGVLWLYAFWWNSTEKFKVDDLHDGVAHVSLTRQQLADRWKFANTALTFVPALEVSGAGWYRGREINSPSVFADLAAAIDSFGTIRDENGRQTVALAPPVRQTLRLISPDGAPQAGVDITVETLGSRANNCGSNAGFGDARALRTDSAGRVSFTAPLAPLYLPLIQYEPVTTPSGDILAVRMGVDMPAEANHVVKVQLSPGSRETFVIRVGRADGQPAAGTALMMKIRTTGCGAASGVLGRADSGGEIRATFTPAEVESLWIQSTSPGRGASDRYLSVDELRELFRAHEITIAM